MILLKTANRLQNQIISNFKEDAVRLMGDNIIVDNVSVIDPLNSDDAHRDGFQLIPASPRGKPNRQYGAAVIQSPRITRSTVYSKGELQGIFCSDGLIENARITDNVIHTNSLHSITLNGVLSGRIERNYYGDGSPLPVVLNNLRIGGGIANIWVKSFKHDVYEAIQGNHVIDNRGEENAHNGTYVENLDLYLFNRKVNDIKYVDLKSFCFALGDLAIACSD